MQSITPAPRRAHRRWRAATAVVLAGAALTACQREVLGALPARLEVAPGILAVHGTPDDDATCLLEEVHNDRLIPAAREAVLARLGPHASAEVILCGHSHTQQMRQVPGGCLVLNPGSVGCPVFADRPAAALFELRSPHAYYAILTRRNRRWGAELMALEYDWTSASRRAAENGRLDWAQAMTAGAVV